MILPEEDGRGCARGNRYLSRVPPKKLIALGALRTGNIEVENEGRHPRVRVVLNARFNGGPCPENLYEDSSALLYNSSKTERFHNQRRI